MARGARGRNWLLFGARHFARDFLYQLEWQRALKRGALASLPRAAFFLPGAAASIAAMLSQRLRLIHCVGHHPCQIYFARNRPISYHLKISEL
jgi:hypothetical protein